MQFIDLGIQQKQIRKKIDANIHAVLDHGKYIMGPEVEALEKELAEYVGVKHAISCSSGTDALLMALMAYNIGPGDAVFTTPFTFIATAEVIQILGATPVFVDIDPQTYNIDVDKLEQAIIALKEGSAVYPLPAKSGSSKITPKGIIPVDLFGLPADYDKISIIAKQHNLFIIEDAAQSFGAEFKNKKACSFGDIGCTSFFPAKPLGGYGDGGMCFTDNAEVADTLESIRIHGKGVDQYNNIRIGVNGRLDTIQAAILLAKFDIFPKEVMLRRQVADQYTNLLSQHTQLITPSVPDNMISAWAQYSILAKNEEHRASLQAELKGADIPSAIYYPKPLHLQEAFEGLGYKEGDCPVCEDCAHRIFSLPMHPYLTKADQEKIVHLISNEA
jgi:UDP-2-acetamido-2-deoxy-ribo-hexuluronate aminotransferase